MSIKERMKYAMSGEDGASAVEIAIYIAIALLGGVALIAFIRLVIGWIEGAGESVDSMQTGDLSG